MADVEKYLNLARRAREEGNAEDAKKFYDMVRIEEPENFEARFYYPYYNFVGGTKGEANASFGKLISATVSIVKEVFDYKASDVTESLGLCLFTFGSDLLSAAIRYALNLGLVKYDVIPVALDIGNFLELHFGKDPEWQKKIVLLWDSAEYITVEPYEVPNGIVTVDFAKYNQKAREYDPSYQSPKEKKAAKATKEAEEKAAKEAEKAKEKAKEKAAKEEKYSKLPKFKRMFAKAKDGDFSELKPFIIAGVVLIIIVAAILPYL